MGSQVKWAWQSDCRAHFMIRGIRVKSEQKAVQFIGSGASYRAWAGVKVLCG